MAGTTSAYGLVATGGGGTLQVDGPRTIYGPATHRALARGHLAQHRLERTVARLAGCLDELSDSQARVLSLRAGLGSRPALTRTQVARRLDLGVSQTQRIERHGLRRLGALDGAGRCAGRAGPGTLPMSSAFGFAGGSGTPTAGAPDGLGQGSQPGFGVKGVSASGGGSGGLALPPPIGDGSDWTLLILLALAALLGVLVRREVRRR